MMQVALNGSPLLHPLTGIGNYVSSLLNELVRYDDLSLEIFYARYWSYEISSPLEVGVHSKVRPIIRSIIPYAYELRRLLSQYYFSKKTNTKKFDLYHEPNFISLDFDGPIVLTAHDLSWIRYPKTHPKSRVRVMNKYFESSLKSAHSIISISEFTTHELVSTFGIDRSKIVKIYLGVSADFRMLDASETLSTLNKFNLKHGKYFLAVGTLEPRKNLQIAVDAFLKLPKKIRLACPLVLVGMSGWKTSEFDKKIYPLTLTREVILTGYLSQHELVQLIAGALTQIYPSLYEGFGLPPLEAMASGVPVIASNTSAIPEVVGDAGILLDPFDVDGFYGAMKSMFESTELRKSYSEKSLSRSSLFSWNKCAQETIDVYNKVLGRI
jgi:glycosyltransferase involved in cell wall biosynthesis